MGDSKDNQSAARTAQFKTRVVRGRPADREFDIEFWQGQSDEAKFNAVWEMIVFAEEFKHGRAPVFDRTITKVIRGRRD